MMSCICPECGSVDFKVGKVCSKTGETVCIKCCMACEYYFKDEGNKSHGCRYNLDAWHSCITEKEVSLNRIRNQIRDKIQLQEKILSRGFRDDRKIANRIECEIASLRFEASELRAEEDETI